MSSIITFTYCSKWNHLLYMVLPTTHPSTCLVKPEPTPPPLVTDGHGLTLLSGKHLTSWLRRITPLSVSFDLDVLLVFPPPIPTWFSHHSSFNRSRQTWVWVFTSHQPSPSDDVPLDTWLSSDDLALNGTLTTVNRQRRFFRGKLVKISALVSISSFSNSRTRTVRTPLWHWFAPWEGFFFFSKVIKCFTNTLHKVPGLYKLCNLSMW